MKRTLLVSAVISAFAMIVGGGPAWAVVALQFSALSTSPAGLPASEGWYFFIQRAITVTALDAFDPTGGGFAGTVRLYTASGTLLASAKVTTADPKEGTPISFYTAKLTNPVSLAAHKTYFIAEDVDAATLVNGTVGGLRTSPLITYLGEVAADHQGMNPTTDATMGMLSPGIFGPNLDIQLGAALAPEPSTWAMLLLGFAGLSIAGYRELRRRAAFAA